MENSKMTFAQYSAECEKIERSICATDNIKTQILLSVRLDQLKEMWENQQNSENKKGEKNGK